MQSSLIAHQSPESTLEVAIDEKSLALPLKTQNTDHAKKKIFFSIKKIIFTSILGKERTLRLRSQAQICGERVPSILEQ